MATETGSTNGQRTGQQAGDGGQAARGGAGGASGTSGAASASGTTGTSGTSPARGQGRGQAVAGRERGQPLTSGQRGWISPFGEFERNPFASLWQISREMDRLMDAFFGGGLAGSGAGSAPSSESSYGRTMWTPQIEVRQREDGLVIHVDLPGVKQEDVQLEATEEGIAISGERSEQRDEGEQGYRRTERTYGSFYRLIPLPEGARVDAAKASMHNGVLEVTVPVERPQRRRIQIEGGHSRA